MVDAPDNAERINIEHDPITVRSGSEMPDEETLRRVAEEILARSKKYGHTPESAQITAAIIEVSTDRKKLRITVLTDTQYCVQAESEIILLQ